MGQQIDQHIPNIVKMDLSAVQWLEKTIKKISVGRASTARYKEMILKLIEEAKEMDKENVIGFTADWHAQWHKYDGKSITQYYNETYGKQ